MRISKALTAPVKSAIPKRPRTANVTPASPALFAPCFRMDQGESDSSAFDPGGDFGRKLFGPPQRTLDALHLESPGGELAGALTGAFTVGGRAAVADQHPPEDRGGGLRRPRVGAPETGHAAEQSSPVGSEQRCVPMPRRLHPAANSAYSSAVSSTRADDPRYATGELLAMLT